LLIAALAKDTNRLDIMQEVAKICYFQRDWDCAYQYYKKFTDLKKAWNLDIYRSEDAKIALVYSKMGMTEEAEEFLNAYKIWAENDESTYKHVNMAAYYAYTGDTAAALELLELFAQQDNYFYWIVLFLDIDPFLDNITSLPDFEEIMNELKIKFEERHQRIKAKLEGQGLI
jgi:hypothetical protein